MEAQAYGMPLAASNAFTLQSAGQSSYRFSGRASTKSSSSFGRFAREDDPTLEENFLDQTQAEQKPEAPKLKHSHTARAMIWPENDEACS